MPLPTNLLLTVVGARLDDLDALKAQLHDALGVEAGLNLRLEIVADGESYTISVTEDEITVRDEVRNKVLASGDREIAALAIKGLEATPE